MSIHQPRKLPPLRSAYFNLQPSIEGVRAPLRPIDQRKIGFAALIDNFVHLTKCNAVGDKKTDQEFLQSQSGAADYIFSVIFSFIVSGGSFLAALKWLMVCFSTTVECACVCVCQGAYACKNT